jgi:hypothetical protein
LNKRHVFVSWFSVDVIAADLFTDITEQLGVERRFADSQRCAVQTMLLIFAHGVAVGLGLGCICSRGA